MTVLKKQRGNCFEYSNVLCSLLIGAGYDAYVVNGYASCETCLADETREICPLLKKKEEVGLAFLKIRIDIFTGVPERFRTVIQCGIIQQYVSCNWTPFYDVL